MPSAAPIRGLADRHDIRTVQELLDTVTSARPRSNTHVLNRSPSGVESPADLMTDLDEPRMDTRNQPGYPDRGYLLCETEPTLYPRSA